MPVSHPELLWSSFVNEARTSTDAQLHYGLEEDEGDEFLYTPMSRPLTAQPASSRSATSKMLIDAQHARVQNETQQLYIEDLELQLERSTANERPRLGPENDPAAEGRELRGQNRKLKAKVVALERQLSEAQARGRSAEELNAKWREQYNLLRKREREGWERLNRSMKQVERAERIEEQHHKTAEALKKRSAELIRCGQRCAELEMCVEHLRAALSVAMGTLTPEALAAMDAN